MRVFYKNNTLTCYMYNEQIGVHIGDSTGFFAMNKEGKVLLGFYIYFGKPLKLHIGTKINDKHRHHCFNMLRLKGEVQ